MDINNYLPVTTKTDSNGKRILAPNEKAVAWIIGLLITGGAVWTIAKSSYSQKSSG